MNYADVQVIVNPQNTVLMCQYHQETLMILHFLSRVTVRKTNCCTM